MLLRKSKVKKKESYFLPASKCHRLLVEKILRSDCQLHLLLSSWGGGTNILPLFFYWLIQSQALHKLKHLKLKVKHNPKYIVVFPGNYVWSQYSDFSNKHHQTQWANLWQHIHWLTLNMSLQCFKCFILNLQLRGNCEGNISKCVRRRLKSVSQICSRW